MALIRQITQTANANITHKGVGEAATIPWNGGSGSLYASGTWDTATVALWWSIDNTNWVLFAAGLTADGRQDFTIGAGVYIRAVLSSVGASTSLAIMVTEVGLNRG